MFISKVTIKNFRLLRNTTLDVRQSMSLLIGKNNTGKTSVLVIFEKFFHQTNKFRYDDFPLALRDNIHTLDENTDIDDLSIRMILEIKYDESDNLEHLSEFILDLDPDVRTVKILFECRIDKDALLKEVSEFNESDRKDVIVKNLDQYLKRNIYVFDDNDYNDATGNDDFFKVNRHKLIKKELKDIRSLISLHIIHARRHLSSSEENKDSRKPLSTITTAYFNKNNDANKQTLLDINKFLVDTDKTLGEKYETFFETFLKNCKNFLSLEKLSVVSNIQSNMLLDNSSQVIYGSNDNYLPEHLNGLGYMNILYLLLQIEITKEDFRIQNRNINLLFIEEPEVHTHPQMQYVFAKEIGKILEEIDNLQTFITSHSSHIVSQSDFEDIRYLKLNGDNVEIKNFHTELNKKYESEPKHFKFLKQYLNIQSAELFFASKVIFIEGITERMLLPYFIRNFDQKNAKGNDEYISLASQNISILEVGANAKVFAPFLEFLGIKTLIITDIDTTKQNKTTDKNRKATTTYSAKQVSESTHTSNETIKYFFEAPEDIHSQTYTEWFKKLCNQTLDEKIEHIKVAYQQEENGYHARSFEDAFINLNKDDIKSNLDNIQGLKKKQKLEDKTLDIYDLTDSILDKKSDFAASLLFLALSEDDEVEWKTPLYIQEGLSWIQKD